MADFVFAVRAQRDLDAIATRSLEQFGVRVTDEYLHALQAACATLGEKPNPGLSCSDFRSERLQALWRLHCGRHVIFYRIRARARPRVRVVRILHASMLPELHL